MAEEERLLSKNHKKPSERRASLMIAYALNIFMNANRKSDDKPTALLQLLTELLPMIPKKDDKDDKDGNNEKKYAAAIRRLSYMANCSQVTTDEHFQRLFNKISETTLKSLKSSPLDFDQKILDFIPEMIIRDIMNMNPDLEKCFIEELKQCSSEVSKLVVQAQNIGLKPIKTMPSCLNPKIAIFRPNILYAGRQELLSVGKIEFKERPLDGLIYCDIDFTIENLVTEKQKGILTLSPDNNFVIFSQTSKESNKAFHNTQTLWQINYDFGDVKSGTFRTITFNPSYFDCQWFILGSCEQSLDMIGTQCSVKALPQSTHIAASRYLDFTYINATYDISREFIKNSFNHEKNALKNCPS